MNNSKSTSLLASFATLKSLSDAKQYQSPYQILTEFIRFIILSDSLYAFSASEMKNRLNDHFGFSIPEAVIKTAVKGMHGITLQNNIFTVIPSEIGTDSLFKEKKKEADEYNSNIVGLLIEY
jgi:hypothetical protein